MLDEEKKLFLLIFFFRFALDLLLCGKSVEFFAKKFKIPFSYVLLQFSLQWYIIIIARTAQKKKLFSQWSHNHINGTLRKNNLCNYCLVQRLTKRKIPNFCSIFEILLIFFFSVGKREMSSAHLHQNNRKNFREWNQSQIQQMHLSSKPYVINEVFIIILETAVRNEWSYNNAVFSVQCSLLAFQKWSESVIHFLRTCLQLKRDECAHRARSVWSEPKRETGKKRAYVKRERERITKVSDCECVSFYSSFLILFSFVFGSDDCMKRELVWYFVLHCGGFKEIVVSLN